MATKQEKRTADCRHGNPQGAWRLIISSSRSAVPPQLGTLWNGRSRCPFANTRTGIDVKAATKLRRFFDRQTGELGDEPACRRRGDLREKVTGGFGAAKREDARDRSLWRLQSNELAGYSNHASSSSASECGSESSRIQHPPARPTVSAGVAPDPRPTTAPSDGVFELPRISHPWLRRKRVFGSPRILHLRLGR